jgi:hypothetical protein
MSAIAARIEALDWPALATELDSEGRALTGALLEPAECDALPTHYDEDERFVRTIVMSRHGFGEGE